MANIRTIGVGGGFAITPTYTTINDWASALATLNLSATEIGRLLWVSAGNELSASAVVFASAATYSGFNVYLEAGDKSGSALGSFNTNPTKFSNPLRYSPSAGACITFPSSGATTAVITLNASNITIRNLQIKCTAGVNNLIDCNIAASARVLDSNIISFQRSGGTLTSIVRTGNALRATNNLLILGNGGIGPTFGMILQASGTADIYNNTLICLQSASTSATTVGVYKVAAGQLNMYNNAFFGWPVDHWNSATASSSVSNNATNLTTASSRLTLGGSSGTGSNVYNLVSADFTSLAYATVAEDFRISSAASSLISKGTTASTVLTIDIMGLTRS